MTDSKKITLIKELAKELGRDRQTIGRWKKKGMPINSDGTYDLDDIKVWQKATGYGLDFDKKLIPLSLKDVQARFAGDAHLLEWFNSNFAAVLRRKTVNAIQLNEMINDRLKNELNTISVHQLIYLKAVLNTEMGITYDKYRLESGESTENVGVVIGAIRDWKKWKQDKSKLNQDTKNSDAN